MRESSYVPSDTFASINNNGSALRRSGSQIAFLRSPRSATQLHYSSPVAAAAPQRRGTYSTRLVRRTRGRPIALYENLYTVR